MSRRLAAGLLAAALTGSVLSLVGPGAVGGLPSAYAAELVPCDEGIVPGDEVVDGSSATTNAPLERMNVPRAHEITRGGGISVVVIDSGVAPVIGIDQGPPLRLPDVSVPLLSGHGTIVAGLIAGDKGVAPDARVIDMRVYDSADQDAEGEKLVTSQGIADGIRRAIELHRTEPFQVVNISLSVPTDDPVLRQAVKDLQALGVVVVASSSNADEDDELDETFTGTPGNDDEVYPADYRGVVGVSAAPPPGVSPVGSVLPNLDTDVAAPTYGAVSVNANGVVCDIDQIATSWAAAEVSGVVALLRAAYPKETPKQTIARLLATTEGSEDARNPWTGAGVVQAHDALTRTLDLGRSGKARASVLQDRNEAVAPPPPARLDLFGSSRALLLWCGLGGGALMALAFMLRSLVRR